MPVGATEILPGAGGFDVLEANEEIAARSPLQLFWRRLRKDRVAMVSLGFVAFLVIVAIAAPLIVSILG
ncbi:MAG: peptide/nickel transport system permease protein, partial [Solirubrobacteraceae bacterium]|nr:peptide/nickel transport system permease protein [Solirubrobacteraceae bacterium]